MKHIQLLFLSFVLAFSISACGDDATNSGSDGGEPDGAETVENDGSSASAAANSAVSTWEGHSLKSESGSKGKWLASVSFGEKMTLLGEMENDGKRDYEKVRLLDGKEGWIRGDLIAKGATMAAVKTDAQIYKRPSISNITDDVVAMGSLVVVKQKKEEFSEFIARNDAANKRKRGWVLGSNALTTNETDIAAAVMLGKAMAEKNPVKRKEKLDQFVNNSSFASSAFMAKAEALRAEADAGANLGEDELMVTGDNVNVRSAPDVDADNKVFQVHAGDICKIIKRGDMAEIGGTLDYWYNIRIDGQEGWVFGSLTSKAL